MVNFSPCGGGGGGVKHHSMSCDDCGEAFKNERPDIIQVDKSLAIWIKLFAMAKNLLN